MEDIELKVKITPEVEKIPKTAKATTSAIETAGGFSDENGKKRKQVIDQLLSSISALIDKGELTKREIKELDRYVSQLYEQLGKAAANTKNVSKEMKLLVEEQISALNKLKEQRNKRDDILEKGKTNEKGTAFTSLKGFNERAASIGIHKLNKDETLSKRTFNDYETIAANMSSGKATYVDKDGKPLAENPEWQKMAEELKKESEELRAANLNLRNFEEALNKATRAVEAQGQKEKAEGKNINPLPAQVGKEQVAAEGAVSAMGTDAAKVQGAFNASLGQTIPALNKQSSSLGRAFKQFTIYALAVRTARRALHSAVKTIKDLDKYLTEQAMVTGRTRQETYRLLKDYQQMAAQLGATTKEVAEVATQFMRQGKTTADALTLTTAAISAAKVAGISATESVNYLTTALNGFQLSAEQAMRVSDKFAAIAAQSATSYEEIAVALSKVAAQANMAGMSIDYTTALLAKGIETTREAPETIGTALKTVIARMRELTDYGATLEDGMDINNVETQLAYVGIALRDTNGELRSTEDVLDDLGHAWDTLSSNQQAAVAKALAGTRQQSRLIAMMTDYERVTELQQISQRSAGATAAQAEVYMEGMEAALNRLSVTWEKIVTTVTSSNAIIGLIEKVTNLLEFINDLLSNEFVLTSSLVLLFSTLILSFIKRYEMQKAHNRALLQQEKTERDKVIAQKLEYRQALKNFIEAAKSGKAERAKLKTLYEQNKALAEQRGDMASAAKYAGLITRLGTEDALSAQEVADARKELALTDSEITGLRIQQTQTDLQMVKNGQGLVSILGNALSILTPILTIMSLINMVQQAINAKKLRSIALTKKESAAESKGLLPKVAGMFAKVVSAFSSAGIPGVIAGITLATALAAALGVGIAAAMGAFNKPSAQDAAADKVNQLSNEIYKLTEKANALKAIEDQFDALDKKIIKTTEDTQKMSEALSSASDKLDSTRQKDKKGDEIEGTSDKDAYDNLVDDVTRREYLERKEAEYRQKANNARQEQIRTLAALSKTEREAILTSKDNSKYIQNQSAVRAINNNTLYEYIDSLENAGEKTEQLTQAILDQLSALDAYNYAAEIGGKSVEDLADAINNAVTTINGEEIRWSDILESDDYDFNQRIKAFEALQQAVDDLNDDTLLEAFNNAFQQWNYLKETMTESTRSFMSEVGMTMDRLNDWGLALQKFGMSTAEAASRINEVLYKVSNGMHIGSAIRDIFAAELAQFSEGTDEWAAAYNKLLNAYQSAMNVSILNVGQSMEALHNRVNNIYEQASKWNELSDTERTTFMNDNADLFSGEDGKRLYEAFKTQNYALIQQALENNEVLNKTIEKRKQELQILLDIEEARNEKDRNEGQIAYLKEQIKLLEQTKDIYRASLKLRLDQENAQLSIYKEYLQKQQQALEDSLNKRKEAYEKYFETINQEAEDEEYEEKVDLLVTNLSKLAASTDAGSKLQSAELEAQLKDLEKERLAELRERAQDAVIQNIDDQLTDISEKFDKLLENNQLMLQAMTAQITGDPTSFASQVLANEMQGLTALGAESAVEEFKTTFGSVLPSEVLDNITVNESTTGDTLILNVAGKEIEIGDSTQQELYLAIMKAMRQLGIK